MLGGYQVGTYKRLLTLLVLVSVFALSAGSALAAGIKVVPSADRVAPGESFFVDIVAENVPALGLGTVQFRLNVDAGASPVVGVPDLNQSGDSAVNVASPLLISAPTATRSGLGDLFLDLYQSDNGILVMDNEALSGGSALFTYAHTNGANLPSGTGSVARFQFNVGSRVAAEQIQIDLTEVMLIDGGEEYPLESNLGATITLRCSVTVPDLNGLTLAESQAALAAAELTVGTVYEIANPGNSRAHDVVLEQSVAAGAFAECETAIDLAINQAPGEVTGLSYVDLAGDDTGQVVLSWTPSSSADVSGYRVYYGTTELADITDPQSGTVTVGNLPIGTATQLAVTAYDSFGNESAGALVTVTAVDDVPPVIGFKNVDDGTYYASSVQPQLDPDESHPASQVATLNGSTYDWSAITVDGAYTLEVTMTDTSDNSTTESVTFTVDQTAPVITMPNVADGVYLNEITTPEIIVDDLTVGSQDAVVSLNGQPYVPGSQIENEGVQVLVVAVTDKAGNQSSLTVNFVLDLTDPTIVINDVVDETYYMGSVNPQVSIDDVNLTESSITLNGNPFVSGTVIETEGVYTLVASASDAAGNEVSQTVDFTIDLSAPVINVAEVTDGAFYKNDVVPTIDFVDAALDETSLTMNGSPYVSGTPVTDEGLYTLIAKAKDLAGNQSERLLTFVVDKTAPLIAVAGVSDGDIVNVDVVPQITISDTNLDESALEVNGETFTSGTTLSSESMYSLLAKASDLAGNSAQVTLSFLIDKTAPVTNLDLGTPQYQSESVLYAAGNATVALNATDDGPAPSGVAGISYTLDGTDPWNSYSNSFDLSGLSEGSHSLTYRAQDLAGNQETALSLAVTIDNNAPETTVVVNGAQYVEEQSLVVTGTTDFTLMAVDTYSGVALTEYRIDDNEWSAYAPFTTSGDGLHSIAYRSTDHLGHVEAIKTLNVTVDDTAPITTITVGSPKHVLADDLFVTVDTVFTLSASDATAGVETTEYRIDSGEWIAYTPFSISAEGVHQIEYRSRDHVGNLEEAQSLSVVIDNTAPTTSIVANQPQFANETELFVTDSTVFTVSAEDALSGVAIVEYRVDDGDWIEFVPFSLTNEGEHTVSYRSTDSLGNVAAVQTLAITVDNTAPHSSVQVGTPQYTTGGVLYVTEATGIALDATDNLAGLGWIEYRIDEGDWQRYSVELRLADLDDGNHVINYRSIDNVANMEEARTLAIVVDNTTPETVISMDGTQFVAADGKLYATGRTNFILTAADELSGVVSTEYRIDDGEWNVFAPFTLSGEGQRLIEYRSGDNLGNTETIKSLTVIIDNTAPETAVSTGEPRYQNEEILYITSNSPITLEATDASSGTSRTEYRIDEGDWHVYLQPFALATQVDGSHSVGYRSVDQLGNLEDEQILALTLDNSAPVSVVSSGQPQFTDADGLLFVTSSTDFTLSANDAFAGVASIEYQLDGGEWVSYAPFTVPTDGQHEVAWRSRDYLGNEEVVNRLAFNVDNQAPSTEIFVGVPQHTDSDDVLYITAATEITLSAQDDRSGVAITEYRIDSGEWVAYAPFNINDEGPHQIEFRSRDNVSNLETTGTLSLIVDNFAPVSDIEIGEPKHIDSEGMLYVTESSRFTLSAQDDWAGVATVEYRIDGGDWVEDVAFSLSEEGESLIEYRSADLVGNIEEIASLVVTVDNTAPISSISFDGQSFIAGDTLLLTEASMITIAAEDNLAGVAVSYYRYDDEAEWHIYTSSFRANELPFGQHIVHVYSVDTVENSEEIQSVAFTLIGAEVNVELLNVPRVLVWTEDPAQMHGKNAVDYTLDDVRGLVANAMGGADAYVELVADKEMFQQQFRSGIFNVLMVLNQDVSFNANFLREINVAVEQGRTGLLVSSWGNNIHPILQEMFGLDFVGSMSMDEDQRELYLFDSELSAQTSLTAYGRILKTRLDGGSVAGVIPAESQCQGVRSLSLVYTEEIAVGSTVAVSIYTQQGRKLTLVDVEQMTLNSAETNSAANSESGNPVGDLSIDGVSSNGVTFTLAAPYGYLESEYLVALTIVENNGQILEVGPIAINTDCDANLMPGMIVEPFELVSVAKDEVADGEDIPAVVLNQHGDGRTVFMSYNLIESAMNDVENVHTSILANAANSLLPENSGVEPAGISLVETTVSFEGAGMDLLAVDTLSEGLIHLPLFDLTQSPLEYSFHLETGEEATYRYFVRFPDQIGDYVKQTELHLELEGMTVPYDNYAHVFTVPTDSSDLLQQAVLMVENLMTQEPASAGLLEEIAAGIQSVSALPKSTSADYEAVIGAVVEVLQDVESLPFDANQLQEVLGDYLRIMQALMVAVD